MEKMNFYLNLDCSELSDTETKIINAGGFAYDLGFLLREAVIYIANGGGTPGTVAAITDFSVNYKSAN